MTPTATPTALRLAWPPRRHRNSLHLPDALLPSPANTRKELSTTDIAYRGWLRKSMNFCMKAISMKRKARPRKRK